MTDHPSLARGLARASKDMDAKLASLTEEELLAEIEADLRTMQGGPVHSIGLFAKALAGTQTAEYAVSLINVTSSALQHVRSRRAAIAAEAAEAAEVAGQAKPKA